MKRYETIVVRLQRAWWLRLDQQVEQARALGIELASSLGLSWNRLASIAAIEDSAETPLELRTDVALLCASLARSDGYPAQCRKLVGAIESKWLESGKPFPFQLHFQRGILAFVDGDYSTALELFLGARSAAPGSLGRLLAMTNALLCLENLGLPLDKTREEIFSLLERFSPTDLPRGVSVLMRAFELRHAFRNGQLRQVFEAPDKPPEGANVQASYYRLWVSELPYHEAFQCSSENEREAFVLADPHFHQKGYRLRTLQGLLHPDDTQNYQVTELADRLYLWTWRWLTRPEHFPAERLLSLLKGLELEKLAYRLTAEDFQLLRNALSWMSLFDPGSHQAIYRLVQTLRPPQARDFPLFELEWQLIQYLIARRDGNEHHAQMLARQLERHPLWNAPGFLFNRLFQSISRGAGGELQALTVISELIHACLNDEAWTPEKWLSIDLSSFRVSWDRGRKVLVSAPMCLGFELLRQKDSVESEEFLRISFGIPRFDPVIHPAKVYNLLARMRQCSPSGLNISVKGGRIYASGKWDGVWFKNRHPLSSALQESPEWRALVCRRPEKNRSSEATDRWLRPALVLKKLRGEGRSKITRDELEQLTGKSKSTTQRMIHRWVEQGILRRTGNARNTLYHILPTREH